MTRTMTVQEPGRGLRLATRAPRRSRCHAAFRHGLLTLAVLLPVWTVLASDARGAPRAGGPQEQVAEQTDALVEELGRALGMAPADIGALGLSPAEMRTLLAGFREETVVVGSRAEARSVTASAVPVDVLTATDLLRQGTGDLKQQLRTIVPSFNTNTQPIQGASTVVRPAMLRNLAPDHVLVLVNGKRRHRSSVVEWHGGNGVAYGSQGPDISVIPPIALRQVEVLRDGAAAQYGSDAIAGVMNFQLKEARSGGSVELDTGMYGAGDGESAQFAGNVGLPIGAGGFANLSLEYGNAAPTNRSIQRDDAQAIIAAGNTLVRDPAQVWGSPRIDDDLKLFGNFGHLWQNGVQWYGHTNYASRKVTGGFYFRNPHTRGAVFSGDGGQTLLVGDRLWAEIAPTGSVAPAGREPGAGGCPIIPIVNHVPDASALAAVEADPNCFTLYSRFPGGFTPQFGGDLLDYSFVTGVRGLAGALTWDASAGVGSSEVDQFMTNTVNASLGFDTPTNFKPGSYRQDETNFHFDLSYAATEVVNVAFGTEWRNEQFTIGAGGTPSWEIGPYAAQGFSSGSNGFNGYRADVTAGTWDRSNVAAYGDLEFTDPGGRWNLGTAVRFENFADFGTTTNGKVSARVALTDELALRAAISSGFRAPTPGQQNAVNVSTIFDFDIGDLVNDGTVPSISAPARLKGGQQLQPETSLNYAAGAIFDNGPFTFTADYFQVDVSDRLALSRRFTLTPGEVDQLLAEGFVEARNLSSFRFFINDFSTRTRGLDLVSTLTPAGLGGATTFSLVFNHTLTDVTSPASDRVDRHRIQTLEEGLPNTRWNVAVNHLGRRINFLARLSFYGSYWDSEDAQIAHGRAMSLLYNPYAGKALLDLEVGFPFGDALTLSVGAQNALNTYPDLNPNAAAAIGNLYGQFSPFGFNGAYYYARINYGWGS